MFLNSTGNVRHVVNALLHTGSQTHISPGITQYHYQGQTGHNLSLLQELSMYQLGHNLININASIRTRSHNLSMPQLGNGHDLRYINVSTRTRTQGFLIL